MFAGSAQDLRRIRGIAGRPAAEEATAAERKGYESGRKSGNGVKHLPVI